MIRYFSMFSGIGGFERGLEAATTRLSLPLECAGYSEIDKNAIKTYERHWPEHVNYGDATAIDPDSLPDFDLLVGGFPCQAFSVAGKRGGFEDTRGTLFFDVARVLDAKQPQHLILENVKGLLSHDGGRTFRTIVVTLADLGYCVEWQVLNCKDFGIPHSRERVLIVGHLGGLTRPPVFPVVREGNPHSTVGLTTETAVARTLTGGGHSGGNHSGMTVIRTPEGDRRLTITECERLQGFADGHTVGSNSARYKQLGNAVPTNLVELVAYRLLEAA